MNGVLRVSGHFVVFAVCPVRMCRGSFGDVVPGEGLSFPHVRPVLLPEQLVRVEEVVVVDRGGKPVALRRWGGVSMIDMKHQVDLRVGHLRGQTAPRKGHKLTFQHSD